MNWPGNAWPGLARRAAPGLCPGGAPAMAPSLPPLGAECEYIIYKGSVAAREPGLTWPGQAWPGLGSPTKPNLAQSTASRHNPAKSSPLGGLDSTGLGLTGPNSAGLGWAWPGLVKPGQASLGCSTHALLHANLGKVPTCALKGCPTGPDGMGWPAPGRAPSTGALPTPPSRVLRT